MKNAKYVIDCIYGKMTPFLLLAQEKNLVFKDGEDMLLYQGVVAFEYFTQSKIKEDTIESMRRGLKNS